MRLARLRLLVRAWIAGGRLRAASGLLARSLGCGAAVLRRDIGVLALGQGGAAYDLALLGEALEGLWARRGPLKAALVGLGPWGLALRDQLDATGWPVTWAAGFDPRPNRLETLDWEVPLFPALELAPRARSLGLEAVLLAVDPVSAPVMAERLALAGVPLIWNATGLPLRFPAGVAVADIHPAAAAWAALTVNERE